MTVETMHEYVRTGLNKEDSSSYRNIMPQKIDMALNEAQDIFIKMVAKPRIETGKVPVGFERSYRSVDEIYTIVVDRKVLSLYGVYLLAITTTAPASCVTGDKYFNSTDALIYTATGTNTWGVTGTVPIEGTTYINLSDNLTYQWNGTTLEVFTPVLYTFMLPADYMYYINAAALIENRCGEKEAVCILRRHDEMHAASPFDESSWEWGEVNIHLYEEGIKAFCETGLTINSFYLSYIRKPNYIANVSALGTGVTSYLLSDGTTVTHADCELPASTHQAVADLAVLILAGNLQMEDYENKVNKIKLDN
jgi:hypothetical protein